MKDIVPEIIGTCPTKKAVVDDYEYGVGWRKIERTLRNETKGYKAAEERRRNRLLKEMKVLNLATRESEGDPDEFDYYLFDHEHLSTEDGIRIARILAGIKNKV